MRKAKRIGSILLSVLILVAMMPGAVFAAGTSEPKAEIAMWEGWRQAAASFTFDDGAPSDYEYIAPTFEDYGYRATFYVVTGWNPNWDKFQELANNGHDIGSHSDTHGDNMVMQKVLNSMGFTHTGIIYVEEDNDPRLAFEKILG